MNVAKQLSFTLVMHPVDAYIDHNSSWFDMAGSDQLLAADSDDEDIRLLCIRSQVRGLSMAEGDSSIAAGRFFRQEVGKRFADDQTPTDDDDMTPLGWYGISLKQPEDAKRSAGHKAARVLQEEFADIHRVETIDIFIRVDSLEHF